MTGSQKIAPGKIEALYFLVGEDDYRKKEILDQLKAAVLRPEGAEVNYIYLVGGETSVADILDHVLTPTLDLFASPSSHPRKLVVVDQAEEIADSEWKILSNYFENPSSSACLVFLVHCSPAKWSVRGKVPRHALKKIYPLKGGELIQWLRNEIRRRGLQLDEGALEELVMTAGSNRLTLCSELDKLSLYREKGGRVSAGDIRELTGGSREASIFDLSRLILDRRTEQALTLVRKLLESGEEPLRMVTYLINSFRKLWLGREAWERYRDEGKACQAAEVKYYRPDFISLVKKFRLENLPGWYRRLADASAAMKGQEKSSTLVLERLIIDLSRVEPTR